eukprot:TRINITY_DN66788_c2_g2_i1.p1 TRINITY_DN66788_c2_g2~~TRINITY_DN66788_c2_g2_i1.p1  ORF type:complete len:634 (-),score=103.10 TRINITY_DN66788_c2_g2_i1:174-2075(-)
MMANNFSLLFLLLSSVCYANGNTCIVMNNGGQPTDLSGVGTATWNEPDVPGGALFHWSLNLCHMVNGACGSNSAYTAFLQSEPDGGDCSSATAGYFKQVLSMTGGQGSDIVLAYKGNPTTGANPKEREAQITISCDELGTFTSLTSFTVNVNKNTPGTEIYDIRAKSKIACLGAPAGPAPGAPSPSMVPTSPTAPSAPGLPTLTATITIHNYVPDSLGLTVNCLYSTPTGPKLVTPVAQLGYNSNKKWTTEAFYSAPACTLDIGAQPDTVTIPVAFPADWMEMRNDMQLAVYAPAGSLTTCDNFKEQGTCSTGLPEWGCEWNPSENKCLVNCAFRSSPADCELDLLCMWDNTNSVCSKPVVPAIWHKAKIDYFNGEPGTATADIVRFAQFVPDLTVQAATGRPSTYARIVYESPNTPSTPAAPAQPPTQMMGNAMYNSAGYAYSKEYMMRGISYYNRDVKPKPRSFNVLLQSGRLTQNGDVTGLISGFGPTGTAVTGVHLHGFHIPSGTYAVRYETSTDGFTWVGIAGLTDLQVEITQDAGTGWLWSAQGLRNPPEGSPYTLEFTATATTPLPTPPPTPTAPSDDKSFWEKPWPYIIIGCVVATLLGVAGFFVWKKKQQAKNFSAGEQKPLLS